MGAWADNIVTISSTEGAPDAEVTISVSLQNSDAISSLQVSIPLDESLSLVENSAQTGSRCTGHSLTVGVKDSVLNILLYSVSMATIEGNSGEVASFKLKLGNSPQTVNLTPSKLVLTNASGASVTASSEAGSVTTRCAKAQYSTTEVNFGEVPIHSTYQRTVTVTNVGNADLTITGLLFSDVNVFSSTTTTPIVLSAGNSTSINITYAPIERGNISKTVQVLCNSSSKLNTITLKAQPFAVNELHVQPVTGYSDETVTVSLTMNNMDGISGFQFEFTLPSSLEYVANSFTLSERKQDHVVVQSVSNGVLRIIGYSPSDKPFTDEDGVLGTLQFVLRGRYNVTLKPSKCVLTSTINNQVTDVCSANYGATITVRSPQISTNSTLAMGSTSIKSDAVKTLTVRNYGNAPLEISRVVFDNEDFYIQESLPITVNANSNTTLTVVYPGTEEGDYSTTMQIYSNDPELRLCNVNVTGSRFAPNFITLSTPEVAANANANINITLDNYDAIEGVQFDLTYPSEYYQSFDNNCIIETRASGMAVLSQEINQNTLRFFCYFLTGESIAQGEGKIMCIQMAPKGNVPEGQYSFKISNIKLGTSEMTNKYSGSANISSTLAVSQYLLGDVNGDGSVDVTDAVAVINAYMAGDTSSINTALSDINGDGVIDITDAVAIINQYLNGQ